MEDITKPMVIPIDAGRIRPEALIDGRAPRVEAIPGRIGREAWGQHRHFQIAIAIPMYIGTEIAVQLNRGEPADDPRRLRQIAEFELSPDPSAGRSPPPPLPSQPLASEFK